MALALLPTLPPEPEPPAGTPLQVVLLRDSALEPYWSHRYQPAKQKLRRHLRRKCKCRRRCRCPQPADRPKTAHRCLCRNVCSCLVVDIQWKSKSILTANLTKAEKANRTGTSNTLRAHEYLRPVTRGDCVDGVRPCPFVSCSQHLFLDVNPENGSIKLNFPMLNPWNLKETCALDVADRGGVTLEEVGELLNISMERIRQVEVDGAAKMREALEAVPRDLDPSETSELPVKTGRYR